MSISSLFSHYFSFHLKAFSFSKSSQTQFLFSSTFPLFFKSYHGHFMPDQWYIGRELDWFTIFFSLSFVFFYFARPVIGCNNVHFINFFSLFFFSFKSLFFLKIVSNTFFFFHIFHYFLNHIMCTSCLTNGILVVNWIGLPFFSLSHLYSSILHVL